MLEQNKIIHGNCIEELKKLPENSIDAIITDPPYGLEFMGKSWDKFSDDGDSDLLHNIQNDGKENVYKNKGFNVLPRYEPNKNNKNFQTFSYNWAKEALRILKPGGYLLSFGGTRTYHRMTCGIEDAGFEIRDCIMWIYGSGFPKSLNIGKQIDKIQGNKREIIGEGYGKSLIHQNEVNLEQGFRPENYYKENEGKFDLTKGNSEWEGWGTALKPACEPIVVARKPLSEKNVALNVLKWGTGGINIDKCRIEHHEELKETNRSGRDNASVMNSESCGFDNTKNTLASASPNGRFPSNILLECTCDELKEGEINSGGGTNDIKVETKFGQTSNRIQKPFNYNENGKEKIKIHTNPNCPCYMLDEQSGTSKGFNRPNLRNTKYKNDFIDSDYKEIDFGKVNMYDDKGGASRFFMNIPKENIYKYCPLCYITLDKDSKEEWKNISANNVEKNLITTPVIKEDIVLKNVMQIPREKLDQIVKCVGNLCPKCTTDFVQNLVVISENPKDVQSQEVLQVMQDFITNSKKCILLQNLVDYVEMLDNIDTTKITQNLLKLFGSVNLVITNYIQEIEKTEQLRFKYTAKASKSERNFGCEELEDKQKDENRQEDFDTIQSRLHGSIPKKNNHPTVKPIKLIEYLVKLVSKEGATILDPFLGSGTTAIASLKLNRKFIGMEQEEDYIKIANARIKPYLIQEKLL
jgi:site-specific DNA-methyltransferase (adenine-specific)